jgi:multiple sugar transport system substrate-binding protein
MRRRQSAKVMVITVMALVAAACAPGGSSATATPSPLTGKLVVWDWQFGSPSGKGFDQIDAAFKKQYPGIQLEHVGQPVSQWATTIRQAFSSQTGPDAIFLDGSPANILQYKSRLEPLNNRVTATMRNELLGFDIVSKQVDNTGNIYALPYNVDGLGIFYNKALFTKAGLDPNKPPQTLSEMLSACAALKSAGIVPVGGGGLGTPGLADAVLRDLWSASLTPIETFGLVKHTMKWTDPKVVAVFQAGLDMWNKGCFDPNWAGIDPFTDGQKQWSTGKVAMMAYYLGYISPLNPGVGDYGVFNPGLATPKLKWLQFGASVGWAITKWSKVKDLAWAYINFMTSKEGEQIRFDVDHVAPTNRTVDISKGGTDVQYFYNRAKSENPGTLQTGYTSPAIVNAMGPDVAAMFTGKQTLQQTLQALQTIQDQQ